MKTSRELFFVQATTCKATECATEELFDSDISLVALDSEDRDVAFVHWTDATERRGRRLTVRRDGTIVAIVPYRVVVEDMSACRFIRRADA